MSESVIGSASTLSVRLGIRGLPQLTDTMIGGGLYVLLAETPSARFPLLAENLGSTLKGGMKCSIIVPSSPELFLQRVEGLAAIRASELIAADQLQIFTMQDEFPKKMFRFGATAFISELEQFEIPPRSYILFDQADEVLSLHDITLAVEQIGALKAWFMKQGITALMVFTRMSGANMDSINALMDNMNGLVRIGGDSSGLKLTFDYWQSPEGTIAARSFLLKILESGRYEAKAPTARAAEQGASGSGAATAEVIEDAEKFFFYMNPDLASLAKQVSGNWKLVDTLVGMMHATRGTRSSTSILVYDRNTNLRQLAETVHTLRLTIGRHAKIIVQEKNASLRYQNEAFLLRLGINLVVHRDVPPARLPLMLESLSGQVFTKDVDINFEAAMASVLPATAGGYLTPARFAREVQTILERVVTLDIPCAMVVGKPTAEVSIAHVMKNNGLNRPGDVITTDGELCYIFLNACPESVVLTTLGRGFKMPLESVLQDARFLVRSEEIQAELAAILRCGDVPDYSSVIGIKDAVAVAPALVQEAAAVMKMPVAASRAEAASAPEALSAVGVPIAMAPAMTASIVQPAAVLPVAVSVHREKTAQAPVVVTPAAREDVPKRAIRATRSSIIEP